MDRLIAPGYFSRPPKVSRGPWFREYYVEDDGLEYYYSYKNADGTTKYLLSNNLPIEERQNLERLYTGYKRNSALSSFAGLWTSYELVTRVPYFRRMLSGWRFVSFLVMGSLLAKEFRYSTAGYYYMPLLCSFYKRFDHVAQEDIFDIKDEKREWFELDTSQYMDYTFDDLDHHHHNINHGPQPDGDVLNASWFTEWNKMLKGEPNNLKDNPKYRDYDYQYSDSYNWPTAESVHDVFHAKEIEQHTPESLLPGAIQKPKD
mmetsp:Transcript_8325/g.7373  ORF Transcript_8325/g.7373 Transcript_8325/m.7373 type:complete len:260 (+) Transcript_8325:18-797(+)|eukprot:CAMPEP_0205808428 /NCGR_PEP_ID=MMETSP0205-20121125/12369_1 /ASSEMBLY_ACC=CAM_ASM_000278 /TAXON_ID=36767 /ORGANISM="Euplotes focardii, Strain TN1" /LENGTH=259 /DNA_ID=CAMNT_0053084071 /DNA_START=14 /DNA_END=793 /DNA_ORIENTATION=-